MVPTTYPPFQTQQLWVLILTVQLVSRLFVRAVIFSRANVMWGSYFLCGSFGGGRVNEYAYTCFKK
jgi:hypothetical protein